MIKLVLISFISVGLAWIALPPVALAESSDGCAIVHESAGSAEFASTKLILKDANGKTADLPLSSNAPNCVSLRKSKLPGHVVFEYWGGYAGTSTLIDTKYWSLVDLSKKDWTVQPIEIETRTITATGESKQTLANVKETISGQDYQIEVKDLEEKKTETVFKEKLSEATSPPTAPTRKSK